ncbi:hypothetical protein Q766_18980 [Flavobacterium subsaxonicum WB 4.1-42 = DSM 21790]|uniref:Uncharacterized protein n=1 Tax=Flavobacterium subsaxonicum WB 4.1-42 = DSM 21790 TaxID=1121898 RepID=A0A0A2MF00_9FLAO|nr:hypothetical protein Q766_18980 [Flavobacterium subsaxonicum WB 4.1-42 = DSM 21790]
MVFSDIKPSGIPEDELDFFLEVMPGKFIEPLESETRILKFANQDAKDIHLPHLLDKKDLYLNFFKNK